MASGAKPDLGKLQPHSKFSNDNICFCFFVNFASHRSSPEASMTLVILQEEIDLNKTPQKQHRKRRRASHVSFPTLQCKIYLFVLLCKYCEVYYIFILTIAFQ